MLILIDLIPCFCQFTCCIQISVRTHSFHKKLSLISTQIVAPMKHCSYDGRHDYVNDSAWSLVASISVGVEFRHTCSQ